MIDRAAGIMEFYADMGLPRTLAYSNLACLWGCYRRLNPPTTRNDAKISPLNEQGISKCVYSINIVVSRDGRRD